MVNNESIAIGRKMDIKLEEEGYEGGWGGVGCRECEEDVSTSVDEIQEEFWSQLWTKPCNKSDWGPGCRSLWVLPLDFGGSINRWS